MSNLSKSDAINILGSRSPISAPGKYVALVTNCGDFNRALANGGSVVAIANFNVMTPYQMNEAKKALSSGDINGALNQGLSLSIRDTDYRPAKKERVHIDVDYVTTKSGEQALMVVGLTPIQATSVTTKCDFSSFLEEGAEVIAEAEEQLD